MIKKIIHYIIIPFVLGSLLQASFAQNASAIDSLLRIINTTSDSLVKIESLIKLSVEIEGSNPDQALIYAQRANILSEKTDSEIWKVRSKLRVGACYLAMNDYSSALNFTEMTKDLAEKNNLIREVAIAQGNLAIIYAELGDYKKSSEYNFQSLKLFEQIKDKNYIGVTLGNIGADFLIQNNYDKALEYMFNSLKIAQELDDRPGIAAQFNNIAGIYHESFKDYKKALFYFNKAFDVNMSLGNKLHQGINLQNIGLIYLTLGKYDSAYYYYRSALEILTKLSNPQIIAACEISLGEYYLKVDDPDSSLEYASNALTVGQEQNFMEIIKNAAAVLHEAYLKKRDFENAYKFAIIQNQAKDTLYFRMNQKELLKMELQYDTDKKERIQQIKQQRKNFLTGFIILSLISIVIIVVLINSRQRIKVKNTILQNDNLEKELNFKNKELSINLMALMKKSEMLSDISKKLVRIENKAVKEETREAIAEIRRELRKNTDNKIWNEFSTRFQEVHADFYDSLIKKYPDLTQNELKLCAYLRLNMSTKDISELTGQSRIALENARYRLRKKFNITNSEVNLVTFLLQI
jgi:tetratricopeptide (TPR) repeat protein